MLNLSLHLSRTHRIGAVVNGAVFVFMQRIATDRTCGREANFRCIYRPFVSIDGNDFGDDLAGLHDAHGI